jgi:hypothetical protein
MSLVSVGNWRQRPQTSVCGQLDGTELEPQNQELASPKERRFLGKPTILGFCNRDFATTDIQS